MFNNFLYYESMKNPPHVRVAHEMKYMSKDGEVYTIPAGFITNLISVPSWMQWLWHRDGKASQASVLHDYLYRGGKVSRRKADALFYEAMKDTNVPIYTRIPFWLWVRVAGWRVYPT